MRIFLTHRRRSSDASRGISPNDASVGARHVHCGDGWWVTTLLALCLLNLAGGCALFNTPAPSATPQPLSWLTNWANQPLENSEPFDIGAIKPLPHPSYISPESLLEVTVWDLYEPEKPHSFPVRVTSKQTIDVPLLGDVPVANQTLADAETAIIQAYQTSEVLVHPKVLVRSLDVSLLKVHVTGAVNRTGFVELSRDDPSVFAALVSAGGLKKNSGTHLSVSRRNPGGIKAATQSEPEITRASATRPDAKPQARAVHAVVKNADHMPRANSSETMSVSSVEHADHSASPAGSNAQEAPGIEKPAASEKYGGEAASSRVETVTWYDLSKDSDRQKLRELKLIEGDTVTVKAAAPPLRISGAVARPGAYPMPAGRVMNAYQALELAGGIPISGVPLTVTVVRPASEGHSSQRWMFSMESADKRPHSSPAVQPGDMIHVEPTSGSVIKQAVGNLWSSERPAKK